MYIMYKVYDKYPNYKVYDDGTITDFDGNKLKTFRNNKGYVYVNFNYKSVYRILKGTRKSYHGYTFRYN